jgi:HTH-type transcriptional regulator/antitoxin HigA
MDIKPIRTEHDYQAALAEIERLFEAEPGTPEGDRLDVWVTLVESYEDRHYVIPLPDPIEAIEYHMQRLGLHRRDLEPYLGSRSRVSEILNRKRPLTLQMIWRLSTGLGISLEVLAQKYPLSDKQSASQLSSKVVRINEERAKYD